MLCRGQAGPVPTEQQRRSRLWHSQLVLHYSTHSQAVNFTQTQVHAPSSQGGDDGVEYTLAGRGFSAPLLNWGPTTLKTCQDQNRSRNQLHLLTCWTLVKPPHYAGCIFSLRIWGSRCRNKTSRQSEKNSAKTKTCFPNCLLRPLYTSFKKSVMVFSFLTRTMGIPDLNIVG